MLATVGSNTRLFLAGRDNVSREVKRTFPDLGHLFMSCPQAESDIVAYVEGAVQERLQSEDLIVGDPSLIEEIKKALREGADGMFLWVTFQIDELCAQHCDDDIRKAILNLPRDLTETFNRALGRIHSARNKDIARKTFQWVAAAYRPLSLDELREAFSIEIGQKFSKPDRQPNEIYRITSWCENLVQVDEEQKLVQFAHHTVQQFLLQKTPESPLKEFHFNLEDADYHIGEICVTYLNFSDFKTTVARRRQPLPNIAPTAIAQIALKQGPKSSKPLSTIGHFKLRNRATPTNLDIVEILASLKTDATEKVGHESTHPFLKYASVNWIFHTTAFQEVISRTWYDWRRMIIDGHVLVQNPWGNRVFSANDPLMLEWSYKTRHYPLLQLITLNEGPSDWDRDRSGDIVVIDILLRGNVRGYEMERALETAAQLGHLDIVETLLEVAANANVDFCSDEKGRAVLCLAIRAAIQGRHFDIVDKLLAAGADANAYFVLDSEY
ncbi:hypothetical protein N7486_009600 [Penicillium sp. IBT 16267x]|nr:hypothetical protein N7486_009600 [Penicillium sp. IBT 16267x]